MKIAQKYSHLNGEEYLIVHHKPIYDEIINIIQSIDAESCKTKRSEEYRKIGEILYSPVDLNAAFKNSFGSNQWNESRYNYYINPLVELKS